MPRPRAGDQQGVSLVELMVAVFGGGVLLLGLFSLYRATAVAFDESSSQAALQRLGTLALQTITRQARRASDIAFNTCAPAGTTSRSLQLTVSDTSPPSLPPGQLGTYCYYAGNGANGAPAGALCQRFTPVVNGVAGAPGACWNLLGASQPGLVRRTGQAAGVVLVQQTSPPKPICPLTLSDAAGNPVAGGQAIASGVHCLALAEGSVPGGQPTGDVAFAITDGLNSMTFTASLMPQN